jgi:SAM-dependent methyltransferase
MCLGNHLIRSHGQTYTFLQEIGYNQWQTLHDNLENGGAVNVKPKEEPPPIYAPTPRLIVDFALEIANISEEDLVYDLGCGDGRVLAAAAEQGAVAIGYELDAHLVSTSREMLEEEGLAAEVRCRDFLKEDLQHATIIYCYLEEDLLGKLRPKFLKLPPDISILSYQHEIPGIERQRAYVVQDNDRSGVLFHWTTPLKEEQ